VGPAEDFLDKGKADELFLKKQGKSFVGEEIADDGIVETRVTVEGAIQGCDTSDGLFSFII
jgi:hypothetical protein